MRRVFYLSVAFIVFMGFFTVAFAYTRDIGRRVAEMHQRIDQGVRSGEITPQEEARLRRELNKIRDDEARMKADGRLSRREIDRLNAELDRLSKHIYREKHDRENVASNISQRFEELNKKIDQGVAAGRITRKEERRLRLALIKIRDDEAKMKADGRLTRREADRLNRELDDMDKYIMMETFDKDRKRRRF